MYVLPILLGLLVIIKEGTGANPNPRVESSEGVATTARPGTRPPERSYRRILKGQLTGDTRPYMVYLRAASSADAKLADTNWMCGGVIIHERYILTSAACIEDASHFYVISGTHKWYPAEEKNNECINNGAKKAVWKCVPKAYFFDGNEFDNIRWMVGDIAVVKVEDNFNFERRIRGCDFIPKMIKYNNISAELENPGQLASMAGWGSTDYFGDGINIATVNSEDLLETDTVVISKKTCKKRWDPRYHFIIDDHMICTKDPTDAETMSAICSEREVNCKELIYSHEEDDDATSRRWVIDYSQLMVDTAAHINTRRLDRGVVAGGFCENDHGGPLVVGQGKSSVVVGVMSACLTREVTHKCYGPFLSTSVYKYRNLISCAINKDITPVCRTVLRSSKATETVFNWKAHSDVFPSILRMRKTNSSAKSRKLSDVSRQALRSATLPDLS
ncbi:uncharacterized protein LOC142983703 [Anticarsia gemmatalis]|uniref:uncharacterized protein LOC142983703 n=1 Tax=Anticarsia gemmatalis TaxID=129554 RepID=UPI003F759FC0